MGAVEQGRNGDTSEHGLRTKEQVGGAIREHRDAIQTCYETYGGDTAHQGRVTVKFLIEPDGRVKQIVLRENTTGLTALPCCIADEFRSWQFPPPGGGGLIVVTYPFVFVWEER